MPDVKDLIKSARDMANREPSLAVYILRDLPEVEAAELKSIAWALSQDNGCTRDEALWFIGLIEAHIEAVKANSAE